MDDDNGIVECSVALHGGKQGFQLLHGTADLLEIGNMALPRRVRRNCLRNALSEPPGRDRRADFTGTVVYIGIVRHQEMGKENHTARGRRDIPNQTVKSGGDGNRPHPTMPKPETREIDIVSGQPLPDPRLKKSRQLGHGKGAVIHADNETETVGYR